jgi:hypothetical protein
VPNSLDAQHHGREHTSSRLQCDQACNMADLASPGRDIAASGERMSPFGISMAPHLPNTCVHGSNHTITVEDIAMNVSVFRTTPLGRHVALLLAVVLATACAGSRMEPEQVGLDAAEQAVSSAEHAGAAEHAPLELRTARDKLRDAQAALDERAHERAAMLAEQARTAAELAAARAEVAKANEANEELKRTVALLRDETERVTRP